jgi:hypothetical protein
MDINGFGVDSVTRLDGGKAERVTEKYWNIFVGVLSAVLRPPVWGVLRTDIEYEHEHEHANDHSPFTTHHSLPVDNRPVCAYDPGNPETPFNPAAQTPPKSDLAGLAVVMWVGVLYN